MKKKIHLHCIISKVLSNHILQFYQKSFSDVLNQGSLR